jgi:hypothetical protein
MVMPEAKKVELETAPSITGNGAQIAVPDRARQLRRFLDEAQEQAVALTTSRIADLAWQAWCSIVANTHELMPVPFAGIGPDGAILFTWDNNENHLELEIFADAPAEFFYRNRRTNEAWECEYVIGGEIPREAIKKISLFLANPNQP